MKTKLLGVVAALALIGGATLLASAALLAAGTANAATYTYDISLAVPNSVGWTTNGSITGEVTTNCTNCWLYPWNIASWSFTGTNNLTGFSATIASTDPNSVIWGNNGTDWSIAGSNLYATSSTLYYVPNPNSLSFGDTGPTPYEAHQVLMLINNLGNGMGDLNFVWMNLADYPTWPPPSPFLDIDTGYFTTSLQIGTVTTPLPTALPLFATGLGALGLLGWRRKKKAAAV
jgi:hypothetical protein